MQGEVSDYKKSGEWEPTALSLSNRNNYSVLDSVG